MKRTRSKQATTKWSVFVKICGLAITWLGVVTLGLYFLGLIPVGFIVLGVILVIIGLLGMASPEATIDIIDILLGWSYGG